MATGGEEKRVILGENTSTTGSNFGFCLFLSPLNHFLLPCEKIVNRYACFSSPAVHVPVCFLAWKQSKGEGIKVIKECKRLILINI